ncbi:MAG TPA: hypothetical protein VNO70_17645 [Blastocatellia bacterium]|nr:hypothetical protein [Blastocatellia bacterium]
MQKRITAVAVLVLAVLMCASVAGSARQGAASITKPDPAALNATNEILKNISRLRGLEVKQPVKSGFKTHDEIEQSVLRDLDETTSPEEFAATGKTLILLGMIPKDFRLREYVVKLLREQVAGFYEPKTREFYLAAWLPVSEQKTVIAHELMHALQDQHFNLRRFEKWPKGDSDAETAAHALVEGEATIVMFQYAIEQEGGRLDVTRLPSITDSLLEQGNAEDKAKYPVLANAPTVLRESLQFPYVFGAGFVQAVLKNGSWQAVNRSYADLPASTEQIMHPEKYLNRDNPVQIELTDLTASLGPDWKKADADVNGEFGYRVLLAEFINKGAARDAAAGWGGDRYALYEDGKTGALALAQFTTWDSARDAREFFDAYAERTEKRYKAARPADAAAQPRRVYQTSEGLAAIELRGNDVVIIEGAVSREQLEHAFNQLWQSKKGPRMSANKAAN